MNVYFDSSALAKRYVEEPGSDRVERILSSADSVGISVLALPEIVSALCRKRRDRTLSEGQYAEAKRALLEDVSDCSVIDLAEPILARTLELLERWPLRSSDAAHVASAAEWSADLFVSADQRQCEAARGAGLKVEEV